MKKSLLTFGIAGTMIALFATGCTPSRDAMAKEYDRLAKLQPAAVVVTQDAAINKIGVAAAKNRNFAQQLMKSYVEKTGNNREYIAFMSDVDYYVKEEKMEPKAAFEKVMKAVQEQDAARAEAEKVWPRVEQGLKGAMGLNPARQLILLADAVASNLKAAEAAKNLKNSFKGFDAATVAKAVACANIIKQTVDAAECLTFLSLQFERVMLAKYFTR